MLLSNRVDGFGGSSERMAKQVPNRTDYHEVQEINMTVDVHPICRKTDRVEESLSVDCLTSFLKGKDRSRWSLLGHLS